jgi:hypothetical protein
VPVSNGISLSQLRGAVIAQSPSGACGHVFFPHSAPDID